MASRQRPSPKSHVRKRPVSFGNPALGTYHGNVYFLEGPPVDGMPLIEGAVEARCLAAMVDVPPEQVPEGILNLARSHRPWIVHVRIVISEGSGEQDNSNNQGGNDDRHYNMTLSPNAAAAESAASILAGEQTQDLSEQSGDARPSLNYVVLFELSSEEAASLLVDDLHEKPFTILDETQVCNIHRVAALEGSDGVSLMSPFFAPAPKHAGGGLELLSSSSSDLNADGRTSGQEAGASHSEVYNCAVCLEHMDLERPASGERTSILTTVCNHSFHMDCLLQWQDSPCPVCRYDHSGLNECLSQCSVCGTTANNYVCLICGVISCAEGIQAATSEAACGPDSGPGCQPDDAADTVETQLRMNLSHARKHYDETLHAYALDTNSQHVWDFAGGGYVHRLLQNKDDGKLVEVSDPNNTTSQERSQNPGLTDAQEGEMVHRKLEGFANQYYTLLKSQLEQQRIYYQGRLQEIRREGETAKPRKRTSDLIAALKQERNQLSQRLETLEARIRKSTDNVSFLVSMNESLEANKAPLQRELALAQKERQDMRKMFEECLPTLQEKVTNLMLQLESESSAAASKPAARR